MGKSIGSQKVRSEEADASPFGIAVISVQVSSKVHLFVLCYRSSQLAMVQLRTGRETHPASSLSNTSELLQRSHGLNGQS